MIFEIALLLLIGSDVILTYYQFQIDKKHNAFNLKSERNILPRKLIGNNPSPFKALIHSLMNLTIFTLVIYFNHRYMEFIKIDIIPLLCGMVLMVNLYHLDNLSIMYENKDNENFWKLRKDKQEYL